MRFVLLILALVASPALARDLPPDPPSYDKPTFDKPQDPTPDPPDDPEDPDDPEEPREPRLTPIPPATALACPEVRCEYDSQGKRRASFTNDVQANMYYLGDNFCESVPADVKVVTACCLEEKGVYKILYNTAVSKKSHWKAKQFCSCVLGLD